MPEEQAPATQETPQAPESGPETGTPAESTEDSTQATDNWQERYQNLQPEYTRASQEAAQYRQIIDRARQGDAEAIEALGLSLAEEDTADDEEYADPDDRIERIEQALAQRQAEEQAQVEEAEWLEAAGSHLEKQLAELEGKHGELAGEDRDFLVELATLFPDENGFPDLVKAYERDHQRLESKRDGWVKSKRSPQVQSGASASSQPDLDDAEQRRAYIARRMAEAESL